jgi:GT2 family glycosyltransferase
MLLGRAAPSMSLGRTRELTLSVIVSQERATRDELSETVGSLMPDLQGGDQMIALGQPSGVCANGNGRVRYIDMVPDEGFIAARNHAAANANGDVLVFCDANVQAPRLWAEPLLQAFRNDRTAAVGPAIADMYEPEIKGFGMRLADEELNTAWLPRRHDQPYAVPLLSGLFFAVRREVFERLGGFDDGMRGGGADDMELSFRLWTSGFECLVAPSLEVMWMNSFAAGALSREDYWSDLLHNLIRLAGIHFGPERFERFVESVVHYAEFEQVYASALSDDLGDRRQFVEQERKYSDDWFFDKFPG